MNLWPAPPSIREICFNNMMNWDRKEGSGRLKVSVVCLVFNYYI